MGDLIAPAKIVFEPHNRRGQTIADRNMPFGYLSCDEPCVPLFELRTLLDFDDASLLAFGEQLSERFNANGALVAALNERDLFSNPDVLDKWANEIDCCPGCENVWWESDTNASGCHKSERAEYCPNDLAETLRAVAKVARAAALSKEQAQ